MFPGGERAARLVGWVPQLGGFLVQATAGAGYTLGLLAHTTVQLPAVLRRHNLAALLRQLFICGVQTIPVTLIVSVFTGMILALNSGLALQQIGQEGIIGRVVAVSMMREMGPFMTGLILAASVGSAMAAELGTMKVSEEIDALEVMAIDPARFLVLPRLIAMAVMTPVLTLYVFVVGSFGGALTSLNRYGVSLERFKTDALENLTGKDVYTALLKAFVFGVVIAIVGCSEGLRARGGAIGVGQGTRQSVVISYLLIIILGYYLTFIFYGIQW
jgi:phospholipid/cholesterol/gamma-HCH transport system permease protein